MRGGWSALRVGFILVGLILFNVQKANMNLIIKAILFLCVIGASDAKKNVIFILVDDLGVADVSFSAKRLNGKAAYETPHLDSLAQSGIELTNYYTHSFCGPSRSAFLTSKYAHVLDNPFPMLKGGSLSADEGSIAKEFKSRGYSTHLVGKWGVDYPKANPGAKDFSSELYYHSSERGMGPLERGFDTFYGLYSSGHNHYSKQIGPFEGNIDWHKHNATHKLDYPEVDNEPLVYSTHLFVREAISTIKTWSSKNPGFLFLSFTAPHDPLQAPQEYIDGPRCRHIKNWRRRTFCGMVQVVDESVGKVVQQLKTQGIEKDTIIMWTSDNGGAPSVGGYNFPYKGEKTGVFQGGLRVPAFIYDGDHQSGLKYNNLMHVADIGPTLLSLSGSGGEYVSLAEDKDGVDHGDHLSAMFRGENSLKPVPRTSIDLEFDVVFGRLAILTPTHKVIVGRGKGRQERFKDPNDTSIFYDKDCRVRFVFEEIISNCIDLGLGEDWFPFTWAFRFMLDSWASFFQYGYDYDDAMPTAKTMNFDDKYPINERTMPKVNWDEYDLDRIFLYDLAKDPYEYKNIALDNKELVESIVSTFYTNLKSKSGHHMSVQKQFGSFIDTVYRLLIGGVLLLVVFFYCFIKAVGYFLRKSHPKQKVL